MLIQELRYNSNQQETRARRKKRSELLFLSCGSGHSQSFFCCCFLESALFVLHTELLGQGLSFLQFQFFQHYDAFYDKNIGLVIDANANKG